jgi:hypothetical protein
MDKEDAPVRGLTRYGIIDMDVRLDLGCLVLHLDDCCL